MTHPRVASRFRRPAQIAGACLAAVGAEVGAGWLVRWGEQAGLYGSGGGLALLVACSSAVFVVLIWRTAAALARAEARQEVTEDAIHESEARKAAILESALDAIVSLDGSGAILEFNPAAERMFALSQAHARGRSLADVIAPPALRDQHREEIARHFTGSDTSVIRKRIELTAMRADGKEFPAELSIARVNRDDTPTYTSFIRDVSDAQRTRADLVRSNDRLRAVASVSNTFARAATSYQALLEQITRTIADLVGDGCLVTLISEDGQQLRNAANAHRDPELEHACRAHLAGLAFSTTDSTSVAATVVRTGKPQRADVVPAAFAAQAEPALRAIVERLNVHGFAAVPIRVRERVIGTLSAVRSAPGQSYTDDDVTLLQDLADRAGLAIENAQLYEQLEQRVHERTKDLEVANRELEAFSYSVAHDLRSPLRGIAGFSQAVLEDYGASLEPAGAAYLRRIDASARRMGELIDDLLDLARVSRVELRRQRVDVSAMARGVLARLSAAEPAREVEVVVEDGLAAQADRGLLDIVLTNLLGNAWKFTGKTAGARIELTRAPGQTPATYVVRDNGAGFDVAYAGKLFGVFERLHADEFEGTGIGLAIVQRIIDRHGGRVWAEGEVGRGATFHFTLEAAPPPDPPR